MTVPSDRIRTLDARAARADGDHVLYWMVSARRLGWNFALDRAIEHARAFGRPLVILEALRCDYRWASDRIHRFVLEGMADNSARAEGLPLIYHAYVEPAVGAGRGLLRAWSERACIVVTDDYPCFFVPRMVEAAARGLAVRCELVDSNGLLPLRDTDRLFPSAHTFRRMLQKRLPAHVAASPRRDPLSRLALPRAPGIPAAIRDRWPAATPDLLQAAAGAIARLPIDHQVPVVERTPGGAGAAQRRWRSFLDRKLASYATHRNDPEHEATSGLSPYLHFGQISIHQIFHELAEAESWSLDRLLPRATGSRNGWWGMSAAAEAFLDQIVTWRELGFNACVHDPSYDRYESLPGWARATLARHSRDPRPWQYSPGELEASRTHDPLWNAAQDQLRRDGIIHNYLRMLWGKKILEWSETPEQAFETSIHLNNKYGLDGRDPNSYSGIAWVFGRYDRPWGPERPIFGSVRYMSSENTARKLRVKSYIARHTDRLI